MSSGNNKELFSIALKRPVSISALSQDELQELVKALVVTASQEGGFKNLVRSTSGYEVKVSFGSAGEFNGIYAVINNEIVNLVPGANGNALQIFKGAPTSSNPGPGWKVDVDLTRQYLNQGPNENAWDLFFAYRVSNIE